jgi:hypothetical protein
LALIRVVPRSWVENAIGDVTANLRPAFRAPTASDTHPARRPSPHQADFVGLSKLARMLLCCDDAGGRPPACVLGQPDPGGRGEHRGIV